METTTLIEVLTDAYAEQWSSADVREGNCSLDLCGQPLRKKPSGKLVRDRFSAVANTAVVYYEPKEVLWCIFHDHGSWWAGISRHTCPRRGKVDAEEAKRLWREWQVRTGQYGLPYAYRFLLEVGLPIAGGLLVKGELPPELGALASIGKNEWEYARSRRRMYIYIGARETPDNLG